MAAKSKAAPQREAREAGYAALMVRAHEAGMKAGEAIRPMPRVVVQRENPFDASSKIVKQYEPIMDGVCGFAWIVVAPAGSSFGRYLRKRGHSLAYGGGVSIWVRGFGQSYERKSAYADAYAAVLKEAGIKAYAEGRLD